MAAPRRAQPLHRRAAPQPASRPTELEDGDRAGAGEDIYSTLSRRHELRRLIEDLADLPEQQRAALLMRELDGLSHEEVASALEVTPAASRQLVKRARSGLVAAAEARDADCAAIREVLLTAHDERRRPSEHALRHVRGCSACREFRDGLKATRGRLRALSRRSALGPLAGILQLLGGGGAAAAGSRPKVAAGGCCARARRRAATTLWARAPEQAQVDHAARCARHRGRRQGADRQADPAGHEAARQRRDRAPCSSASTPASRE